eukprot:SAG31_NODE_22453_length_525_cov_0.730047_2_plen_73_part_01
MLLSRFCATIREIRDFHREKYGINRESVTLQDIQDEPWLTRSTESLKENGGKRSYFLVFVQLFEKYGTLFERN